jgi:broad specificity phosphatase PhoE
MRRTNLAEPRFSIWKTDQSANNIDLQKKLFAIGLLLDMKTGHIFYCPDFTPLKLSFDLIFVRHGETYGNCGQSSLTAEIDHELVTKGIKDKDKRIYQGNVDTPINQLTEYGEQQALNVATKLKSELLEQGWEPDIILISPLSRARNTALPFATQNAFDDRCIIHDGITEMSFGSWENHRVCDMPASHPCHSFYLEQNALVKAVEKSGNDLQQKGENFCEVLLRAYNVLLDLEAKYADKRIVAFSHSMFGAAFCILLGFGKKFTNSDFLAFDGKDKNGHYFTMPNAEPVYLNFNSIKMAKKNNI